MKKLNKATVLIIASMLVLALTLAATFSWFPRVPAADTTYGKLTLNTTAVIKAEKGTVKTYKTTMIDGVLDDSAKQEVTLDEVTLDNKKVNEITIPKNGFVYFISLISDTETANNSYSLSGLKLTGTTTNISVCNLSPYKTSEKYSDSTDGMVIAEHITGSSSNNGASNGARVEWYLYNSGSSDVTLKFAQLPTISFYE